MSKSKKSKTVRKEVKKEVKAIKRAARSAPKASKSLRQEVKAIVRPTVRGKGGYFGDLGGKLGGVVDGAIGLGKVITGLGSYKVKQNSVMESGAPPQVRNTRYSTTVTGHPEYICDIKSSVDFAIQKFPINPGISRTFPWLAPEATGYEQYKPKGVLFEFRSTCGDAIGSSDNAMGVVIMATEYNVHLPDFTDKQQMEDHEYRTAIKPSENGLHPVECARSKTVLSDLYVRNGSEDVPDLMLYDQGNFYIATQGQQTDGVTIGELWVTYEYEFLKPALSGRTTNNVAQHWYWDSSLGSAPSSTKKIQNLREINTGATTNSLSASFGQFNVGKYFISVNAKCDIGDITWTGLPTFSSGGALLSSMLPDPATGAPSASYIANSSGSIVHLDGVFDVTGSTPVSITALPYASAISGGGVLISFEVWIIPMGNSIQAKSRRPVDHDPLVVMSRRLNELSDRLAREEARHRAFNTPSWARSEEDEKYVRDVRQCLTPPSSPVIVEPEEHPLTRSQTNIASFILDRVSREVASKTGPFVRAA